MKKHTKSIGVALAFLLTLFATGCGGSAIHTINLSAGYSMKPDTKIEVGSVVNQTGKQLDIDVGKMLTYALTKRLQEEHLLAVLSDSRKLVIESKIVEYEKGNAFKRWLSPGWGSTVLAIRCDLKEGDVIVGTAAARRTVDAGGGYTIGAWKTVFGSIAKDLVKDLKKQMPNKT
jgi:hypothetical protein